MPSVDQLESPPSSSAVEPFRIFIPSSFPEAFIKSGEVAAAKLAADEGEVEAGSSGLVGPQSDSRVQELLSCDDPDLLRGSGITTILRGGAAAMRNSNDSEAAYQLSTRLDALDAFISHNWAMPRWRKFLILALHFNLVKAVIAAVVVIAFCAVLEGAEVIAYPVPGKLLGGGWGFYFSVPTFIAVLLLSHEVEALVGCKGPKVFVDKTCVHQADADIKCQSVEKIGAFLNSSTCMVVCYGDLYLKNLWTLFEVVSFLMIRPATSMRVVPTLYPIVVFGLATTAYAFYCILGAVMYTISPDSSICQSGLLGDVSSASGFRQVFLSFVPLALSCVMFALLVMLRQWAREQESAYDACRAFSVRQALLYNEPDRPVVESQIVAYMKGFRLVHASCTDDEALRTFEAVVQDAIPKAFAASFGRFGIPLFHIMTLNLVVNLAIAVEDPVNAWLHGCKPSQAILCFLFYLCPVCAVMPAMLPIMAIFAQKRMQCRGVAEYSYLACVSLCLSLTFLCLFLLFALLLADVRNEGSNHATALYILIWCLSLGAIAWLWKYDSAPKTQEGYQAPPGPNRFKNAPIMPENDEADLVSHEVESGKPIRTSKVPPLYDKPLVKGDDLVIDDVSSELSKEHHQEVEQLARRLSLQCVNKNPTMAHFLQALKNGGGPQEGPTIETNQEFFQLCDSHFPELKIYCTGRIQTSPGVDEVEGSPTEYYRTTGALIALISAYATSIGDDFGLDAVCKGNRGPMSMDKVPGKFINMGNKPKEYTDFCKQFAETCLTEDDWWAMMVFLAVHDVGKSDVFRNAVNATLPARMHSDDHDRALVRALSNMELKERFLPSVLKLTEKRQEMIATGFRTNFQLPQLGQGEIAVGNLSGLLELPRENFTDGTLVFYLYHSIFDIAGASSNANFIYPLALAPVYMGFSTAIVDLIAKLKPANRLSVHSTSSDACVLDEVGVYFEFLYTGFAKAYPEFEEKIFRPLCKDKAFRDELGIVVLRVLALTRNTYKNPHKVMDILSNDYKCLVREMCGTPENGGMQIMLYYAPDMLRMGLGEDLTDESGENMHQALGAMSDLFQLARTELTAGGDSAEAWAFKRMDSGEFQYQLNVQPIVTEIKTAGKAWTGGKHLRNVCDGATIRSNDALTEGIIDLAGTA